MDENKNTGFINVDGAKYKTTLTRKYLTRKKYVTTDPKMVTAFIPGLISKVYVKKGKKVKEGDTLLTLDAMKMANNIDAPFNAVIKAVNVKEGDNVAKDQVLIEFK